MKNAGVVVNGLSLWALTRILNTIYDRHSGGERRPAVFDIDRVRPDLRRFDRNFEAIRTEVEALLTDREGIPRYHDVDPLQHDISAVAEPEKRWQVFLLNVMGRRIEKNCRQCPATAALVEETPELFQAFFSILEGGKSIPAHSGIYRGYLRYHLGLKVPRERAPRMRVKDQFHEWREGGSILFDDSWEHEVTNEASELRVVLIVDVLRPMPWFATAINRATRAWLRLHYGRFTLRQPYFR